MLVTLFSIPSTSFESTRNIHTPGIPTLVVTVTSTISSVLDCGTAAKFSLSPALKPTRAGTLSKEPVDSPVIYRVKIKHCIAQQNMHSGS